MTVTPQALDVQARLDAQVQAIEDTQTRALVAAWALAWSEVSADLQDTLLDILADGGRVTRATMLRSTRLRRVLVVIADQLMELADLAGVTITADLDGIVDLTGRMQDDIVAALLPNQPRSIDLVDRTWTPEGNDALAAIVKRSTEQITSRLDPLSDEATDAVRRELIRGIAAGTSPRETAARMVRRAEKGFNGGLTRAMTIARTETLDAYRQAAQTGQDRHTDVLAGWVWLCDLSARTCPACLGRHGTEHSNDVAGPDGHQNCRCARMPRTKTWAELGFEGLDDPGSSVPDAQAWFEALPEVEQLKIMGRERLDMLRAGEITWADLATVRHTTGWRDSWVVTPVRVLRAQSRGRLAS